MRPALPPPLTSHCTRCGALVKANARCANDGVRAVRPPPPMVETAPTREEERDEADADEMFGSSSRDNDNGVDDEEEEVEQAAVAMAVAAARPTTPAELARMLMDVPVHNDIVYGYVERVVGPHVITLLLFSADDDSFQLAATMRATKTGDVAIHTRRDAKPSWTWDGDVPWRRGQPHYVATVRPSSMVGLEFVIADAHDFVDQSSTTALVMSGVTAAAKAWFARQASSYSASDAQSPAEQAPLGGGAGSNSIPLSFTARDLALVAFAPNVMGSKPNTFQVTVRCNPLSHDARGGHTIREQLRRASATHAGSSTAAFAQWPWAAAKSPLTLTEAEPSANAGLYNTLAQDEDEDQVATFVTKEPEWSEAVGGFTLEFNGRVSASSKKNCLLVPLDERAYGAGTVCFRFGKNAKHRFALDFRYPFSPVVALGTAACLFASKLAVS